MSVVSKPFPRTYKHGQCYLNAYINIRNCYADRGLKLVIGSLGINGWFEYGGKTWGKAEFMRKVSGHTTDSHTWLEDADGNVYDFLFSGYNYWVKIRTGKPMRRHGLLEGVSKAELAADGIEYVPAPKDAQAALFCAVHKYMKTMYDGLVAGTYFWVNDQIACNVTTPHVPGMMMDSLSIGGTRISGSVIDELLAALGKEVKKP